MSSPIPSRRKSAVVIRLLFFGLCLTLNGCIIRVNNHCQDGLGTDGVSVVAPFNSVHVQSSQITAANLGLPVYPGAVEVRNYGNNKSANVDMGLRSRQMVVKVVNYSTPTTRDRVIAFYRKAFSRFGSVIACKGESPVGTPAITNHGLTCDEGHQSARPKDYDADSTFNLRVGSVHRQRIVVFRDSGDQDTRFTLIELVLPSSSSQRTGIH